MIRRLVRKYTQCIFGTHWRMKYDSGSPWDIIGAGTCQDCGYRTEGIKYYCQPPPYKPANGGTTK